jgi:hypothetical protein
MLPILLSALLAQATPRAYAITIARANASMFSRYERRGVK